MCKASSQHVAEYAPQEKTMRIQVQTLVYIAMAIAPAVAQVIKYGI